MCYNGVIWLSKVCYYVSMADSVYYNMFCIADMLQLYSMASRICSQDDSCSKSYKDLIKLLKQHLAPKVNVVAERYKYRKCEQAIGQTITEFIIELKASSQSCDFGTFLQQALRDQFVAGVHNSGLRTKLLTEEGLTFEKAYEIGRSWEAAEHECKEMQEASKLATLKPRTAWKPSEKCQLNRIEKGQRMRDLSLHWNATKTVSMWFGPAKQWTCYACGMVGHVLSLCRSKNKKKIEWLSSWMLRSR